jgi:glycosyltransferase involved in cell wall biosynthesis
LRHHHVAATSAFPAHRSRISFCGSALSIDLFLAPSQFLLERYVDWGISRERIRFEEYGRLPFSPLMDLAVERPRDRFGFFGQFSFFKGVQVLLKAMSILGEDEPRAAPTTSILEAHGAALTTQARKPRAPAHDAHLWLHGANLEVQVPAFQEEFKGLLDSARQNVTLVGRYEHTELPKLMANIDWVVVPSIWWENSPLVIQEAFAYGRPVICSDIGGMAEKVTHGVNGLHFRADDPHSLAQVIRQAATTPGLWEQLKSNIPPVYAMEDHVAALTETYDALLERTLVQR